MKGLAQAISKGSNCMWDKLALAPFALQGWFCPSRTSDTVLLALCAWFVGLWCGCSITALVLSPSLRRCLLRGIAYALQEAQTAAPVAVDRLQRYRQ